MGNVTPVRLKTLVITVYLGAKFMNALFISIAGTNMQKEKCRLNFTKCLTQIFF